MKKYDAKKPPLKTIWFAALTGFVAGKQAYHHLLLVVDACLVIGVIAVGSAYAFRHIRSLDLDDNLATAEQIN